MFDQDLHVLAEHLVPTTTPAETLGAVIEILGRHPISSLGIASFGPLVVDPGSPMYGSLAATPKPAWSNTPILGTLRDALDVPSAIATDVEAAALAEHRRGAGVGCDSIAYVTVGTGVGVGVLVGGQPFRGRDHLELGHMPVERDRRDDFTGLCPFHGDCLEGLASGPALADRCGTDPAALAPDDDVWQIEAEYLAQLACVITWAFSPDRILFGGGVGARAHLAPQIADATKRRLGGYSVSHADNHQLIGTAGLGNDAGLIGAGLLGASMLSTS